MRFTEQPLSAIERARIAYEQMVARKREFSQARMQRERTRVVRLVVGFSTMAVLLIGTAVYNGWLPQFMSRDGATAEFGHTRTGQIRSFVTGNTCQELQFNNVSGAYVGSTLVPCEVAGRREALPPPSSGQRVLSIRDAFTR